MTNLGQGVRFRAHYPTLFETSPFLASHSNSSSPIRSWKKGLDILPHTQKIYLTLLRIFIHYYTLSLKKNYFAGVLRLLTPAKLDRTVCLLCLPQPNQTFRYRGTRETLFFLKFIFYIKIVVATICSDDKS